MTTLTIGPQEQAALDRLARWQDAGCPDDKHQLAGGIALLMDQLTAAQAEVRALEQVQSDVLANLDAPDDMDVISAAHFVAGSLSTAEEALEAAQAEARELRGLITVFAGFTRDSGWFHVADELERRLAAIAPQPAEQHDPLAVSDHCGECGEPEPECVCGEQPAERESQPLMARRQRRAAYALLRKIETAAR